VAFRAWLANEARPVPPPRGARARRGERLFLANACADCHTLRGTPAHGVIGPDLTHMAGRRTLAALAIPNTRSALAGWIRDPQHPKPGNRMPGLNLSRANLDALVAYLEGLR
jgi:cytochrome c oxidase subunit 2